MRCKKIVFFIIQYVSLVWLPACRETDNPTVPDTGDWTVHVRVYTYSEFYFLAPTTGTMIVTLSSDDRSFHAVVSAAGADEQD